MCYNSDYYTIYIKGVNVVNFEIGKTYFGFNLVDEYEIKEIQSTARIFEHAKSGAQLLHLENNDDNKVFSIGFRTPPSDSTGVPHIIEHSVLSGSKKYKTKEPFMDMLKGSLQTFINAMTFADKTIYPIASRNEKDFFNLMDVYLDAVFYPSIYEKPEIFMQEGWHHELFENEDDIEYKGVVYNEMKGAYSSPEAILEENISKSLYPDTCYRYSSGGNPDVIPELSYEAFLAFHKKFYHPSNSYIYLYGNGDIQKQLKFIDENYLSKFDKIEVDSHIHPQKPFTSRNEIVDYYPISSDENEENRTYLSLNFVLGEKTDSETYLMSNILSQLLIESQAAPLKKELIDAGIGEDIFPIITDGVQLGFGIVAKNTSLDKKEEFEKIVFDTLNKLVKEGIDKKLIQACINIIEYNLREAENFATKGLIYNIQSLDSWLYDSSPTTHLQYDETINKIRANIDNGYFEKFIEEKIINNFHSSMVIIEPKKGLGEEKIEKTKEKLADYKKSLTEKDIEKLIAQNEKLKTIQLSDDTEEAKATIPKLSISDVEPKALIIPQEIIKDENYTILYHDIFTSKIAYVDFYFDISMIDEELIPYTNVLAWILGKMDTESMTYSELSNEIYVNTGGINFNVNAYGKNKNSEVFHPKFIISGKAIGNNIAKLLELTNTLITESKLEDKKRVKELLQQLKSRIEMIIFDMGHSVASVRVGSYFSPIMRYMDKINGLDFYWFLSDILENFDENCEEIMSNLDEVYKKIFNINNLIVSFTGDKEDFAIVKDNLKVVTKELNKEEIKNKEFNFSEEKLNEGILSAGNVQYVSKGYNFKKLGYSYNGSMIVLATILNGDYLHNRIRARGGAYGAGISFDSAGHVITYSYRDPNLKETIEAYDNMADYIKNLSLDDSDLTTFIIGTISRLDPALTPHMKGQIATVRYISNISQGEVQKTRDEVLNTKLEDIRALSPILEDTMKQDYLCVLGNEHKIRENKEVFNNIVKLKK